MNQSSSKLNKKQWLALIVFGMAYTALGNLQYLAQQFYVIYKDANGLSDGQMGTILSAVGVAAVVAYFYNGFIADLVRPKVMMMFSTAVAAIMGTVLLFNPGYIASILIFCSFALLPLWTPMSKLLAGLSTEEQSNTVFAGLDFFIALAGLFSGFLASWAVAGSGAASGVRTLIISYIVMNVICCVAIPFIDKSTKEDFKKEKENSDDSFNLKNIKILFSDPDQWLAWLGIGFGYTAYIGMTYATPLLSEVFGISDSAITIIDTVRGSAIGLIAPLLAYSLAAKYGAVKSYFLWLGFYIAAMAALLILPWQPAFAVIAVAAIMLLAFSVKGRSAISNTVLTNIKTPLFLFGTSVGIESLFMSLPDTFSYTLAGNAIDNYGNTGYYMVFGACLAFAVLGLICNIILDRRLKAGKTSEAFFAAKHGETAKN